VPASALAELANDSSVAQIAIDHPIRAKLVYVTAATNTGHGTHVAGTIAGGGTASKCATCTRSLQGMAPGANIVNLRVLDKNGASSDSIVITAIDQAIALKSTYNIRVMNLSLGRPIAESYTLDPLCQAVEAAWKAGIVVVVAAGNDGRINVASNYGYGTINAPANDPYVLTVGVMKTQSITAVATIRWPPQR